ITSMRRQHYATMKDISWANYYMGLNLPNTVGLMRKTPFPATIPVIDLVSEINFPTPAWSGRWADCHRQLVNAQPGYREGITAHGCGHFIFRDNPPLVIGAIVKAYTGVLTKEQRDEIMNRYLSYSLENANEEKRREVHQAKKN
ncbi:MAG TPA: hypothetical protein VKU83_02000, partial [Puia sp.]|nr:hypothetical protein [Puia sp.]